MSSVLPTDKTLVQRGTTLHSAPADMSTVQDTDLLLINRAGVDYKCSVADWKASQSKPPAIASVTLADSPEAGRFTSGTFRSTVVMTDEGIPASTKGIKAYVQGTLLTGLKGTIFPMGSLEVGAATAATATSVTYTPVGSGAAYFKTGDVLIAAATPADAITQGGSLYVTGIDYKIKAWYPAGVPLALSNADGGRYVFDFGAPATTDTFIAIVSDPCTWDEPGRDNDPNERARINTGPAPTHTVITWNGKPAHMYTFTGVQGYRFFRLGSTWSANPTQLYSVTGVNANAATFRVASNTGNTAAIEILTGNATIINGKKIYTTTGVSSAGYIAPTGAVGIEKTAALGLTDLAVFSANSYIQVTTPAGPWTIDIWAKGTGSCLHGTGVPAIALTSTLTGYRVTGTGATTLKIGETDCSIAWAYISSGTQSGSTPTETPPLAPATIPIVTTTPNSDEIVAVGGTAAAPVLTFKTAKDLANFAAGDAIKQEDYSRPALKAVDSGAVVNQGGVRYNPATTEQINRIFHDMPASISGINFATVFGSTYPADIIYCSSMTVVFPKAATYSVYIVSDSNSTPATVNATYVGATGTASVTVTGVGGATPSLPFNAVVTAAGQEMTISRAGGQFAVIAIAPAAVGASGTVGSINTTALTMTLATTLGTWGPANAGHYVIGPTKTGPAAGVKLFCKLNPTLHVTDLQSADPGYTAVTGAGPYTVTFPATLPTGAAPDVDLPAGTSLTTEVQAVNSSATVTKASNTVVPT